MAATPEAIESALQSGLKSYSFRYELRQPDGRTAIGDITPAVEKCSITHDNSSVIHRTARFVIDANNDGGLLTGDKDHVAVIMDLVVDGVIESLPLGVFVIERVVQEFVPVISAKHAQANERWTAEASDLTSDLIRAQTNVPYEITSGTNYADAIETIIDNLNLGLQHNIQGTEHALAENLIWAPGTQWIEIVNNVLAGINYFPISVTSGGVFTSRVKPVEWHNTTADVLFDSSNFILPAFKKNPVLDQFFNEVIVRINDPRRAPFFSKVTNEDPTSLTSTVSNNSQTRRAPIFEGDLVVNQAMATIIAKYIVRWHHYGSNKGTLMTSIDPRREAHELYRVNIDGVVNDDLWIVDGWSLAMETGARMTHNIRRAEPINDELIAVFTTDDL